MTHRRRDRKAASGEPLGAQHQPLPAPAPGQPGRVVAVVSRGVRRGARPRRTRAAVRRLRRLPLVPRDGARVLRGLVGGRDHERRLRQRQGRPGGAAGRRRGLHGGVAGDARPGRLADDRVPDPGRGAVLLRHVLPAAAPARHAVVHPGSAGDLRHLAAAPRRTAGGRRGPRAAAVRARSGGARGWRADRRAAGRGGFGGAPKFPPSMCLEFLLRTHARTGDPVALHMVEGTATAMARGGIYDQLGGGFARYSVDASWVVPHFEKMLYDNALLLRVYVHWWRATGSPLARRIGVETAEWMLRDLATPEGGFASAYDADSEGEEGRFYVWTPAQLVDVLGADDGAWAAELFAVTPGGTFEHGSSVLQLPRDPADADVDRTADVRRRLASGRQQRVWPARDDKVVAAWNGLAIAALADAAGLFDRDDLLRAAERAAGLLVRVHLVDGRLWRTSRDGRVGPNAGVLDDYGDVAEGFLALYAVTGNPHWLRLTGDLLDVVLGHFGDGRGGFYDTADDAEALLRRPQDGTDNATPSGSAAAAGALLSYAAYTGSHRHRAAAEAALGAVAPLARQHARFIGWAAAARCRCEPVYAA